jgi:hypothetical protein
MTHIESLSFGGALESTFRGIGSSLDTLTKDFSTIGTKTVIKDTVEDGLIHSGSEIKQITESGIQKTALDSSGGIQKALELSESGIQKTALESSENILTKETQKILPETINKLSKFQTFTDFVKANPKGFTIAGTSIVITATIAGIAGTRANTINNTLYSISSIKSYPADNTKTIIYYTPNDKFAIDDTVTISKSNCLPNINNDWSISHIGPGTFVIDQAITANGNFGNMRCQTTFSNQLVSTTVDGVKTITAPIIQTTADIVGSTLKTVADSAGLTGVGDFLKSFWWIAIIICILSIMSSLSLFVLKFAD